MNPNELASLWKALVVDCRTGVAPKDFNNRQRQIANEYKRLTNAEQGEYHRIISEWRE